MKYIIFAKPAIFAMLLPGLIVVLIAAMLVLGLLFIGIITIVALVLSRRNKAVVPLTPPGHPPMPTSTQVIPSRCPKCGAPMPFDSPEGLCPRCLIAMNLATQTEIPGEPSAAKVPPGPPLPAGDIAKLFPQLEILECLGRGGMGSVYKARQPRLDRIVALKILSPEKQGNQKFSERFEREARALARLHHPNIVAVYDFGETQGNYYLLMEFVDGLTLRQLFHDRKLSPAEALVIVPKICEALQYAHGLGIIHRDIKPENILIDKNGNVKIADFGIAKILGDGERTNLTEEQAIGTPHYMSPEQIERPQSVDHRADIYSLGVVFYEMLTGELPLGKFQPPSKKVQVDVRLDEIVLRSLEKEPERRYQQASEVKTRVESLTASGLYAEASPGQRAGKPDHFWRWFAVICLSLIVMAVMVVLLTLCIPAFLQGRQEAEKLRALPAKNSDYLVGPLWFPLGDVISIDSMVANGKQLTVKGNYLLHSHSHALLKLSATGALNDAAQSTEITQGAGHFELTMTRTTPGLPHVSMYAGTIPFVARYFGKGDEYTQEQKLFISTRTDPVALWLPTGIGTNADDPKGHNGMMQNVTFTDGVIGSAFSFNPDRGYSGIQIPDDPAFAVTKAFSIEGWIRPTGPGYIIFWRGDRRPGLDPYAVSMDGTKLKFTICDEFNDTTQVTTPISYNHWVHFAAVYDNGRMTLYTNGVPAAEINTPIRPFADLVASQSPGIGIGNLNDGGNNFPYLGDIDDLAFYGRALSPLEVQFNYEVGFKIMAGPHFPAVPSFSTSAFMLPSLTSVVRPPNSANIESTQTRIVQAQANLLQNQVKLDSLERLKAPRGQQDDINRITLELKNEIQAQEAKLKQLQDVADGGSANANPPSPQPPTISPETGLPISTPSGSSGISPETGLPMPTPSGVVPISPQTGLPVADSQGFRGVSLETGLPLPPGSNPDLENTLKHAEDLTSGGQYEDSLQALISYFNQSKSDPSQAVTRLTTALSDWTELSRHYPRAKVVLVEIRDSDTQKILNDQGTFTLFNEVRSINRNLDDDAATCALFIKLDSINPQFDRQYYFLVEDQLIGQGQYEICRKYVGDPQQRYERIHKDYLVEQQAAANQEAINQKVADQISQLNQQHGTTYPPPHFSPDFAERMKKSTNDQFVYHVRNLVEILVATGGRSDAEKVQQQALTVLDDPRLQSAMADARAKVDQQKKR